MDWKKQKFYFTLNDPLSQRKGRERLKLHLSVLTKKKNCRFWNLWFSLLRQGFTTDSVLEPLACPARKISVFFLKDRVSLCSSGGPGTHCADQVVLKSVCATIPSKTNMFNILKLWLKNYIWHFCPNNMKNTYQDLVFILPLIKHFYLLTMELQHLRTKYIIPDITQWKN